MKVHYEAELSLQSAQQLQHDSSTHPADSHLRHTQECSCQAGRGQRPASMLSQPHHTSPAKACQHQYQLTRMLQGEDREQLIFQKKKFASMHQHSIHLAHAGNVEQNATSATLCCQTTIQNAVLQCNA